MLSGFAMRSDPKGFSEVSAPLTAHFQKTLGSARGPGFFERAFAVERIKQERKKEGRDRIDLFSFESLHRGRPGE